MHFNSNFFSIEYSIKIDVLYVPQRVLIFGDFFSLNFLSKRKRVDNLFYVVKGELPFIEIAVTGVSTIDNKDLRVFGNN